MTRAVAVTETSIRGHIIQPPIEMRFMRLLRWNGGNGGRNGMDGRKGGNGGYAAAYPSRFRHR